MKIVPVILFECSLTLALSCVDKIGNDGRNNFNHRVVVFVLEPFGGMLLTKKLQQTECRSVATSDTPEGWVMPAVYPFRRLTSNAA